ncbi:thioredoxin family protein [Ramlibacter humi]|uniref:DUF255 domain-containing protein n=1 Tax=Ramlibacter humi TaxID=2530451 RepID=A0A4Z0BFL6_9BURK|nr:DUF255 domain-containing protein [Ramlibacter humi]TFY97610.1 DUF255 domain-containing protein [Ramlibacter humi]
MSRRWLLAVLVLLATSAQANPPEKWGFVELDAAMAQAKEQNKPVFLLFGFQNCPWCEYMYRTSMRDDEMREMFQRSVVLAYFDTRARPNGAMVSLPEGGQVTNAEFVKRFKAYPTPSWLYLTPTGEVLGGNRNAKTTARELKFELEKVLAARK